MGINLFSILGTAYARMQKTTDDKVGEEQGGFRYGRGCTDMVASMGFLTQKRVSEQKTSCISHKFGKEIYGMVDWEGLQDALTVYGEGGQVLMVVKLY